MTVSKRLRYEILRRDNHTCRYCGATAPDAKLTVDHVTPVTLGGSDASANLVAACADCNAGKSATPPSAALIADVDSDALRWAGAVKRAAEIEATEVSKRRALHADLRDEWVSHTFTGMRFIASIPDDWTESIDRMVAAGLTADDLHASMHLALTRSGIDRDKRWRYFCGIAWRTVERRHETARQILSAEDAAS